MGPGCFHPRNAVFGVDQLPDWMLQWGRDVSIPEMNGRIGVRTPTGMLQWGRDVSIPEMLLMIPLFR